MSHYPATKTEVLIGSKASDGTRTSIEMESTYQAESVTEATKTYNVGGYEKANFDILYTMGAAETANSIEITLEGSTDGINFYAIANDATSLGVSTLTAREFTFVGTNGAAATISIILDIGYKLLRFKAKETGVATNKGSVFVESTLSGK